MVKNMSLLFSIVLISSTYGAKAYSVKNHLRIDNNIDGDIWLTVQVDYFVVTFHCFEKCGLMSLKSSLDYHYGHLRACQQEVNMLLLDSGLLQGEN